MTTVKAVKNMDENLINELSKNPEFTNQEDESPEEPAEEVPSDESPEEPQEEDSELDKPISDFVDEPVEEEKDSVPLATFLEIKKELAALKEKNQTQKQENESLSKISEKYDVDESFLSELSETIRGEVEKKYEPIIKKQEQERITEKKNKVFNDIYEKVISSSPELKDIVNKDVVKKLALDPSNKDKSVRQIISDIYGNIASKIDSKPSPSFEKPSTGTKSKDIDFANLSNEDHELIASDSKLREKYGEYLQSFI